MKCNIIEFSIYSLKYKTHKIVKIIKLILKIVQIINKFKNNTATVIR